MHLPTESGNSTTGCYQTRLTLWSLAEVTGRMDTDYYKSGLRRAHIRMAPPGGYPYGGQFSKSSDNQENCRVARDSLMSVFT
jgi:hypothetical protein